MRAYVGEEAGGGRWEMEGGRWEGMGLKQAKREGVGWEFSSRQGREGASERGRWRDGEERVRWREYGGSVEREREGEGEKWRRGAGREGEGRKGEREREREYQYCCKSSADPLLPLRLAPPLPRFRLRPRGRSTNSLLPR